MALAFIAAQSHIAIAKGDAFNENTAVIDGGLAGNNLIKPVGEAVEKVLWDR